VQAYLDWHRFGQLPMPLWSMPRDLAHEVRFLADNVGLAGPWLTGFGG
jgi:hypothetical protein